MQGSWRTPTIDEIREIINNCDKGYITLKAKVGIYFRNRQDDYAFIFIPVAGFINGNSVQNANNGVMCRSVTIQAYSNTYTPHHLYAMNNVITTESYQHWMRYYYGLPIRAVQ